MKHTNGEDSVYPLITPGHLYADGSSETPSVKEHGLSKREYFAALAMQGMLNNWMEYSREQAECEVLAKAAVNFADAIIEELNKKP